MLEEHAGYFTCLTAQNFLSEPRMFQVKIIVVANVNRPRWQLSLQAKEAQNRDEGNHVAGNHVAGNHVAGNHLAGNHVRIQSPAETRPFLPSYFLYFYS